MMKKDKEHISRLLTHYFPVPLCNKTTTLSKWNIWVSWLPLKCESPCVIAIKCIQRLASVYLGRRYILVQIPQGWLWDQMQPLEAMLFSKGGALCAQSVWHLLKFRTACAGRGQPGFVTGSHACLPRDKTSHQVSSRCQPEANQWPFLFSRLI